MVNGDLEGYISVSPDRPSFRADTFRMTNIHQVVYVDVRQPQPHPAGTEGVRHLVVITRLIVRLCHAGRTADYMRFPLRDVQADQVPPAVVCQV